MPNGFLEYCFHILTGYKSREHPVNPATNEYHGQDIGDIAFEHVSHHAGVCHRVLGNCCPFLCLEVPLHNNYFVSRNSFTKCIDTTELRSKVSGNILLLSLYDLKLN